MIPSQPWRKLAVATMFRRAPAAAVLSLTRVTAIPEPDGVPWFSVLRR